jgi:hypothetical protein
MILLKGQDNHDEDISDRLEPMHPDLCVIAKTHRE